jgi:hypothetical protein
MIENSDQHLGELLAFRYCSYIRTGYDRNTRCDGHTSRCGRQVYEFSGKTSYTKHSEPEMGGDRVAFFMGAGSPGKIGGCESRSSYW